jgi:L-aspartate oxidase
MAEVRHAMSDHVGVERDRRGLGQALETFDAIGARFARLGLVSNILITARLIARAALAREESRGAHYRSDFPNADPAWQRRSTSRMSDVAAAAPADLMGAA